MTYHKINSIFKRDMDTVERLFILGEYADPAIEYLKNNKWDFTEKIDGTNTRVMFDGKRMSFGGRTENAQMPIPLIEKLQEYFTYDKLKAVFPPEKVSDMPIPTVTLYGEGCGFKIQKGGDRYVNKEKRVDFILFDVRVGDLFLRRDDVQDIAHSLGIKSVPLVGHGTIDEAIEMASNGFESIYGDFMAEGLVLRPSIELCDRRGHRIVTKVKHKDFVNLRENSK